MAILDPVTNFGKVTVSTGYSSSDTSIVLTSGDGAKLPDPSSDGDFNLVWWNVTDYADPAEDPYKEIVRVTDRSTDTLTITHAQEGTSAQDHNIAGKTYQMVLAPTKKTIDDINAITQDNVPDGTTYKQFDPTTVATAAQGDKADTALQNVLEDTTPQLGGELDMNGHSIGGNTEAQIDDAVSKKHTQNTDTALGAQTQDLDMNTHKVVGVVDPTNVQDAATKNYVDGKSKYLEIRLLASDTALAVATSVGGEFRVPDAMTITDVGAYVDTASTSGTPTIDINEAGTSILSTKITIDENEKSSQTAATPSVISDSSIAADAILTFDVDVSGTGTSGLVVWIKATI